MVTKKSTKKRYTLVIIIGSILATVIAIGLLEYFFQISRYLDPVRSSITREVRPEVCTMEYAPVCAKDGKTYSNVCMARAARVDIIRFGACQGDTSEPQTEATGSVEEMPPFTSEVIPPLSTATSSGSYSDTGSYQIYKNINYHYTLSLPKYAYYQGTRGTDGATHMLAVGLSATGVIDFASAPVRVYYFAGSGVRASVAGQEKSLEKGIIVIQDDGSKDPKIQKIIETILASARSEE